MSKFARAALLAATTLGATPADAQQINRPETLSGIQQFAALVAKKEVPSAEVDAKTQELIATLGRQWVNAVLDSPVSFNGERCARVRYAVSSKGSSAEYTASLCTVSDRPFNTPSGVRNIVFETQEIQLKGKNKVFTKTVTAPCAFTFEQWGAYGRVNLTCKM